MGQGVLAPPPIEFSGAEAGSQFAGTNAPNTLLPAAPPVTPTAEKPLLQWGPVDLHLHLFYQFLYGDGVPAAPGQGYTTAINALYPGVLFQLGEHWTLDYTPSLRFYSNSHYRDTIDNAVTLTVKTE